MRDDADAIGADRTGSGIGNGGRPLGECDPFHEQRRQIGLTLLADIRSPEIVVPLRLQPRPHGPAGGAFLFRRGKAFQKATPPGSKCAVPAAPVSAPVTKIPVRNKQQSPCHYSGARSSTASALAIGLVSASQGGGSTDRAHSVFARG